MAAERTATLVNEYIEDGYKIGIYTVTTVAANDWVDLSASYELIRFVSGYTTADGTDQNGYCSGTDAKAYFVAGTPAASRFMVIGTSTDSVGGAT